MVIFLNRNTSSYSYLMISGTMLWSPHINNIASKASKLLNFVGHNLNICSSSTKASEYLSLQWSIPLVSWILMRPYISSPWAGGNDKLLYGCCQIMEDMHIHSSENAELANNTSSFKSRLIFFYKMVHKIVPLTLQSYLLSTQYIWQDNIMSWWPFYHP